MKELLEKITVERPVGTPANSRVNDILEAKLREYGYEVQSLPFECNVWKHGEAVLTAGEGSHKLNVSPFSEGISCSAEISMVRTLEELKGTEAKNRILVICGKLAGEQLQPKDYPFYFPDEHKEILSVLEEKAPLAIISVTGKDEMSGLDPFPMFNDGNFLIPSAYCTPELLPELERLERSGDTVKLDIVSEKKKSEGRQLVGSKKSEVSKGRVILCAHMDTVYGSMGALDNATGVISMLETARQLNLKDYDVEVVPFNGEEYYEASGELAYLGYLQGQEEETVFAANFDSPLCAGAGTGVSFYNLDEEKLKAAEELMPENGNIVKGQEWYSGDHAVFVFAGTSCMAVSSSNLFEGALRFTHTQLDTLETVSLDCLQDTAQYVSGCIEGFLS